MFKYLIFFYLPIFLVSVSTAQPYRFELSKGKSTPDWVGISPSGKYLIRGTVSIGLKLTDNDNPDFAKYISLKGNPIEYFFTPEENYLVITTEIKSINNKILTNTILFDIKNGEKHLLGSSEKLFVSPLSDTLLSFLPPYTIQLLDASTLAHGRKLQFQQKINHLTVCGNGKKWAILINNTVLYGDTFTFSTLKNFRLDSKMIDFSLSFSGRFLTVATSNRLFLIDTETNEAFEQDYSIEGKIVSVKTFDDAVSLCISSHKDSYFSSELVSWSASLPSQKQTLKTSFHEFTNHRYLQVFVDSSGRAYWKQSKSLEKNNPLHTTSTIHSVLGTLNGIQFFGESQFILDFKTGELNKSKLFGKRIVASTLNHPNAVYLTQDGDSISAIFENFESKSLIKRLVKLSKNARFASAFSNQELYLSDSQHTVLEKFDLDSLNQFDNYKPTVFRIDAKPNRLSASSNGKFVSIIPSENNTLFIYNTNSNQSDQINFTDDFIQSATFVFDEEWLLIDFESSASLLLNCSTGKRIRMEPSLNEIQSVIPDSFGTVLLLNGNGILYEMNLNSTTASVNFRTILSGSDIVSVVKHNETILVHRVNGQIDFVKKAKPMEILGTIIFVNESYLAVSSSGLFEGDSSLFELFYVLDNNGKPAISYPQKKENHIIKSWLD